MCIAYNFLQAQLIVYRAWLTLFLKTLLLGLANTNPSVSNLINVWCHPSPRPQLPNTLRPMSIAYYYLQAQLIAYLAWRTLFLETHLLALACTNPRVSDLTSFSSYPSGKRPWSMVVAPRMCHATQKSDAGTRHT